MAHSHLMLSQNSKENTFVAQKLKSQLLVANLKREAFLSIFMKDPKQEQFSSDAVLRQRHRPLSQL